MERRVLTVVVLAASGCWAEEPLIHGAFTAEQWATIQAEYRVTPPTPCDPVSLPAASGRPYDCDAAAAFGQQLFFEPKLSGPWWPSEDDPNRYPAAQTSCSTCHAATSQNDAPAWYVDIRSQSAVSMGAAGPTPHNTMTLVNVDVPIGLYADERPRVRQHYGWTGQAKLKSGEISECNTPSDVVTKIALPKAMQSDPAIIGKAIRGSLAYTASYTKAFGATAALDDASIQENVVVALGTYVRRLVSLDAPFDRFIAGDDNAIDESAKRGFALFVGRAMCAECHHGAMFTDDRFHVTGIEDAGLDKGRDETGAFYTPTLRNIAKTAPYMHKGTHESLGAVIELYNRGGGTWGGYWAPSGLDPLMHAPDPPLDAREALDLQEFLLTLTGAAVPDELRKDTHVP